MDVNPFESNNGLRVTGRTSQSINLEWPEVETLIVFQDTECGSDEDKDRITSEKIGKPEEEVTETESDSEQPLKLPILRRNGNWTEIQMKKNQDDWVTVYTGYGKVYTINGLSPDLVVTFRMKRNHETEWGSEIVASTTPSPASIEDINRAVEMNSEYLLSRILNLTRPELLKRILKACDRNGMTPLMVACHTGTVDIAKNLIEKGSDVNATSPGTWRTPLIFATIMGHQNIIVLLHRYKANWQLRDKSGCCALDYAVQTSNLPILRFAFPRTNLKSTNDCYGSQGWPLLMRAAILTDNLDILRFLINKGADPNGTDISKSKSVLLAAILAKKPPFVKYLLRKGADPRFRNLQGKTCIDMAKLLGYREITEILTTHIASVELLRP